MNMARPSDSGSDGLEGISGISAGAESDSSSRLQRGGQGNPQKQPKAAEETDLQEYARSLGADASDEELLWVVREAFEAPLPSSWTEHVDAEGRVYFFNKVSEESTWSHPMDCVYRELIALIIDVRSKTSSEEVEARAHAVREHLMEVHGRSLSQLEGWSGPYSSETGQYYYNERLQQSTWMSPISAWEYELAVRHSVLHRSLLPGFQWPEEPPAAEEGIADLLTTPWLNLPAGLARAEEDEKSSARSFYTARDSARSVTPRSGDDGLPSKSRTKRIGGGVASSGASTPPTRVSPPQVAVASSPRGSGRATLCEALQGAVEKETSGELEVTFGTVGNLKMPAIQKTQTPPAG